MKKSKKYVIYASMVLGMVSLFTMFTLPVIIFESFYHSWVLFVVQSIEIQLPFVILMPIYCKKQGINPWLNLSVCLSAITFADIVFFAWCAGMYLLQYWKLTLEHCINDWLKFDMPYALPAVLLVIACLVCSTIITVIKPKFLYHAITISVLSFVTLCTIVTIPILKISLPHVLILCGMFILVVYAPFSIFASIYASKKGINKWVNFAVCSGVMLLSSIVFGTTCVLSWRNSPFIWHAPSKILVALEIIGVFFGISLVFPVLSLIFTSILGERGDKKLAEKSKG